MVRALEVQVLTRENIKPLYPTPHHLRNFKLSLMDQITFPIYVCTIFLYKADGSVKSYQISQRLKSSLSKTLTKFYPFAGRLKDDFSIVCNDQGAEYVEALANGFLSEYLQKPDQKLLRDFHPFKYAESSAAGIGDPMLRIQATFFKCGGLAIAVCTHHKLIDGSSVGTFVNSWTATARADCQSSSISNINKQVIPAFVAATFFPASESFVPLPFHNAPTEANRYVFDASKIDQLRAKVASASVPRPSRVEVLTALIWKCAKAASRSNLGYSRPSLSVHAMNVRAVAKPPLPENSVGNSVGYVTAQASGNEIETVQDLVLSLRKAKAEYSKKGLQTVLETKNLFHIPESLQDKFEKEEIDFYTFSSTVNFPFYELADFGWGKPVHVTISNYVISNLFVLMDTNDRKGIEVLVFLSPEDLALFERDQELLSFATVNPPVLDVSTSTGKNVSPVLRSTL
ncbi:hypothetical protein WN944_006341 [Citrus x changshan-huyou]|uniref:HXXXD-type acyl-transferase family protein n=3 Tax=Citrus TaxID=2706 RepID=A0ACB8KAP6_CITSI|nr:HXXXD-type acyl-transferase family protein [Citrus sinensis]